MGSAKPNLDLPTAPEWLRLPRGVRVEVLPLTTRVVARSAPSLRIGAIRASGADLDADMARGPAFAFLIRTLARHAVIAWEGVGDRDGANALADRITAPLASLHKEGERR